MLVFLFLVAFQEPCDPCANIKTQDYLKEETDEFHNLNEAWIIVNNSYEAYLSKRNANVGFMRFSFAGGKSEYSKKQKEFKEQYKFLEKMEKHRFYERYVTNKAALDAYLKCLRTRQGGLSIDVKQVGKNYTVRLVWVPDPNRDLDPGPVIKSDTSLVGLQWVDNSSLGNSIGAGTNLIVKFSPTTSANVGIINIKLDGYQNPEPIRVPRKIKIIDPPVRKIGLVDVVLNGDLGEHPFETRIKAQLDQLESLLRTNGIEPVIYKSSSDACKGYSKNFYTYSIRIVGRNRKTSQDQWPNTGYYRVYLVTPNSELCQRGVYNPSAALTLPGTDGGGDAKKWIDLSHVVECFSKDLKPEELSECLSNQ